MADEKQIEHSIDREYPGLWTLCEQWKKETDPEKRNALIEEILKLCEHRD
jgi:hypothetical protein